MTKLSLSKLKELAVKIPGLWDEVWKHGKRVGNDLQLDEDQAKRLGLGDMVEKVAHPVAYLFNLPCLDAEKKGLRPDSPCAKRRDALNDLGKTLGIGGAGSGSETVNKNT